MFVWPNWSAAPIIRQTWTERQPIREDVGWTRSERGLKKVSFFLLLFFCNNQCQININTTKLLMECGFINPTPHPLAPNHSTTTTILVSKAPTMKSQGWFKGVWVPSIIAPTRLPCLITQIYSLKHFDWVDPFSTLASQCFR